MDRNRLAGSLLVLLGSFAFAHSQALPTATRRPVQVGGGFSIANADYGEAYIKGITGYASMGLPRRFGIEADAHYNSLITPYDFGENTYELGLRYSVLRQQRYDGYVKFMPGLAQGVYQQGYNFQGYTDTFYTLSFGAGMDIRVRPHINVRAIDFEAQKWPDFKPHSLSPFVVTFGAAYVF